MARTPSIRSATFRGRRYRITFKAMPLSYGECDDPRDRGKEIRLHPDMDDVTALEIAIHEGIHACLWDLDETTVGQTAMDLGRFLWRLGYRRVDPDLLEAA